MDEKPKILIIQTAFIGDAILLSAMIESIFLNYPSAKLELVVRKGNEALFAYDERIAEVHTLNKQSKWKSFFQILNQVKKRDFDYLICVQRFFTAGLLGALVKAKQKICFSKNLLSFLYDVKVNHQIQNDSSTPHEVVRNNELLKSFCNKTIEKPRLILNRDAERKAGNISNNEDYYVLAPSSVWFTKKLPNKKWIELINRLSHLKVFLIGAPADQAELNEIISASNHNNIENLAGKLSLIESAALMKNAKMNFVNDSAPLHLASATNAPVTAFFCSTVPEFGFGPLSENSIIVETKSNLSCKPCGLHGKKTCPKKHFDCGNTIQIEELSI